MAHEEFHIRLEAYIDGEMPPAEAAAFAVELASDPELKATHEDRLAWRRSARQALGGGISSDFDLTNRGRRWLPSWPVMAVAASLVLAVLVPELLRNDGTEGPRSTLISSGQVTALRFGEIPGQTVMLETGAIEFTAGFSR